MILNTVLMHNVNAVNNVLKEKDSLGLFAASESTLMEQTAVAWPYDMFHVCCR